MMSEFMLLIFENRMISEIEEICFAGEENEESGVCEETAGNSRR